MAPPLFPGLASNAIDGGSAVTQANGPSGIWQGREREREMGETISGLLNSHTTSSWLPIPHRTFPVAEHVDIGAHAAYFGS